MGNFVDECGLHLKGGDGGAGAVSVRRESHVPKGGPDGGDGGKGGDVWVLADRNVASLLGFKDHPHRRAGHGAHGQGQRKHGSGGADQVVHVPVGTVVRSQDGEVLADLAHEGDRWLGATAGRGGRGNARFQSSRRRAPSFAEQGEAGEERWLRLELKLMADVALVGFPNAGKSTLISRLSAAKPKIADYPFTTLEPNLGVVVLDDTEFVVADIPGLIEGASEGRGLGHQFLRHIERARVLALLIDLSATEIDPVEQERILLDELGRYRPELLERRRLVVGTKADVDASPDWKGERISAVTSAGISALKGRMAETVVAARNDEDPALDGAFIVHRPEAAGLRIERTEAGIFVVHGRQAERAVALSDITNPDALAYAEDRLKQLGLPRALARAGAHSGDTVMIGAFSFDYEPD